jgi:hypothetical protein
MNKLLAACLTLGLCVALSGCKEDAAPPKDPGAATPPAGKVDDHGHDHAPAKTGGPGHGGAVIELGTTTIGQWSVRASRDEGAVTPGGDAPIDVWVTTAAGEPAKVAAVRFWVGTQGAEGAIKAKADIEDPAEPNRWHTHVEVPSPMPEGAKLWVEIEDVGGEKVAGGFDLKQ